MVSWCCCYYCCCCCCRIFSKFNLINFFLIQEQKGSKSISILFKRTNGYTQPLGTAISKVCCLFRCLFLFTDLLTYWYRSSSVLYLPQVAKVNSKNPFYCYLVFCSRRLKFKKYLHHQSNSLNTTFVTRFFAVVTFSNSWCVHALFWVWFYLLIVRKVVPTDIVISILENLLFSRCTIFLSY